MVATKTMASMMITSTPCRTFLKQMLSWQPITKGYAVITSTIKTQWNCMGQRSLLLSETMLIQKSPSLGQWSFWSSFLPRGYSLSSLNRPKSILKGYDVWRTALVLGAFHSVGRGFDKRFFGALLHLTSITVLASITSASKCSTSTLMLSPQHLPSIMWMS